MLGAIKKLLPDRHPARLLWHKTTAMRAAMRCGFPARGMWIIGITGTDGKTTTVAMTAHILRYAGQRVGAVSTSFFQVLEKTEQNPTHKTSLSPVALQRFLRRCKDAHCDTVIVECSSHGLVQHRLDYLWPDVAAITNISPEHLDYHGTMEQYAKDKGILFRMLDGKGTKVLNLGDTTYESYSTIPSEKTIVYAREPKPGAALSLTHIVTSTRHTTAQLTYNHTTLALELHVPGAFNLDNALCAIACALAAGVPVEKSVEALKTFGGVPGRLERIDEGQAFSVFVDFTVTPRAYEETLATVRSMMAPGSRLLVLTGSCGNRMREKRPMIGKIVSDKADVVVVSEDETVTEDPLKVIDEVWAGVDPSRCEAHKVPNRREAIRWLLKNAKPGDAVMLCGMGACQTMQTLEGLRPWDEREIAREELKAL